MGISTKGLDPTKRVHKVTITFKDKTKIEFCGIITEIKFEQSRVVALGWKNVDYTRQSSLRTTRLRFVDITAIRSVEETAIDATGQYEFDETEYSVVDTGKK
jgi:hypothetical protein